MTSAQASEEIDISRRRSQRLVGAAVHQHKALTRAGLSERAFTFASVTPRTLNPQSGLVAYRALPIVINPVDGARYRFDFGPGDSPPDDFVSVDLTLTAAVFDLDPRAIPVGYVLTAIGLAGFALSFRRRKPVNPNQKPPAPRWGRDV